jgi:hypothetical protein
VISNLNGVKMGPDNSGPYQLKMTIEKFESKDGGTYRYIHEDEDGK